jgi:hypothetical protein
MSSWMDQFSSFQDDQRVERLQTHCKSLERLLTNCRETGKSSSEALEQRGLPLRNIKYFDWRGIAKDHPKIEKLCTREEHLVWACRAVTIGCGRELGALKGCFQTEGALKVLSTDSTAYEYERSFSEQQVPCQNLQKALGKCVTTGAHELYERRRKRQTESEDRG